MTNYPTYKLGEICETTSGGTPNRKNDAYYGGHIPWVKSGELGKGVIYDTEEKITEQAVKESSAKIFPKGTLLIALYGATIGKLGFLGVPAATNQAVCGIFANEKIDLQFLSYYLFHKRNDLIAQGTGGAQPNISQTILKNLPVPLPPLPTQRLIVSRIESLFAELDKGVEHLRTAQQQIKTYRQAVLRDAFEGNLTKEWRKHNHISDETWEEKSFNSIAEIKSNLVDVTDYKDYPHIAPDNIEKETGKLLEYHTIAEDGVISGKHRFFAGQILYSKIRPNLSKVVIVDFDGLCSADMYPIEAKGNTKFLWYQMLSDRFVDYASNSGSRTVLPKINQKGLSIIPMKICSIEEQNEVVIQIESRLSQASASSAYIENALQQADALRQSILKKAFSGELV